MVEKLRMLQAVAARAGVILTLETHVGQITERPADALWLCQQVPGLGLTLDPSHYFAGPNQGASFDELLPFVQGTGFRAGGTNWATIQLPWGDGPIDFTGLVRKLEARGYKGFYVAEYIEGLNQLDPVEQSRRFLDWANKL
jgi:sugar phosphate isomerase/epimerase